MLSTLILLTSLFLWPLLVLFPNMHRHIRRRLPLGIPRVPNSDGGEGSSSSSNSSSSNDAAASSKDQPQPYEPSVLDVVVAKIMLQQGLKLPPEVVLSILDFAEYWPHTSAVLNRSLNATAGRPSQNLFVLRSKPLGLHRKVHYDDNKYIYTPAPVRVPSSPDDFEYSIDQFHDWIGSPVQAVEHPCRKIVFTITSHDQGWGGDRPEYRGTYLGSYTWFEAGLERFDKNAERPKDADERDPSGSSSEKAALQGDAQEQEQQHPLQEQTRESPSSSSSSFIVVNDNDDGGEGSSGQNQDQNQDQDDLPHPYLPVYALLPIQPPPQPDHPEHLHHTLNPNPEYLIQCNKTATGKWTTHKVVWAWDDNLGPNIKTTEELRLMGRGQATGNGSFVRNLKLGDVVTVWAKARFGGWANHVQDVRMDVYWAL